MPAVVSDIEGGSNHRLILSECFDSQHAHMQHQRNDSLVHMTVVCLNCDYTGHNTATVGSIEVFSWHMHDDVYAQTWVYCECCRNNIDDPEHYHSPYCTTTGAYFTEQLEQRARYVRRDWPVDHEEGE